MKPLDIKLTRDLMRQRGQIIAIALVVACGIASFVSMLSAYDSLKLSQASYYEQYRFAQVFAQLKRALESLAIQIIGIALAVAILVVGSYFSDAMQHIIDVQFRNVQREDVMIVFNEPRPSRVQYEVAHLPGVLRAETFRAVPAKLHFEHRDYRIALTGLEPNAELRRLLNKNEQIHDGSKIKLR